METKYQDKQSQDPPREPDRMVNFGLTFLLVPAIFAALATFGAVCVGVGLLVYRFLGGQTAPTGKDSRGLMIAGALALAVLVLVAYYLWIAMKSLIGKITKSPSLTPPPISGSDTNVKRATAECAAISAGGLVISFPLTIVFFGLIRRPFVGSPSYEPVVITIVLLMVMTAFVLACLLFLMSRHNSGRLAVPQWRRYSSMLFCFWAALGSSVLNVIAYFAKA